MSSQSKSLQSNLLQLLNAQPNTFVFKSMVANIRGVPDVIVFGGRITGGIEIKQGDDTLKPLQHYALAKIVSSDNRGIVLVEQGHILRMKRAIHRLDDKINITSFIEVMTLEDIRKELSCTKT